MKHAATRMLFSYWDALRGERAAPERGEIEPGEIRHILSDTFILELGHSGHTEFRLAGTRLCALFGRELKGRRFMELWGAAGERELLRALQTVTDETAGVVAGLKATTDEGGSLDCELLMLPLRHRGQTHARVLGALSPAFAPTWLGFHPVTALATGSLRVIWPSGRAISPSFGVIEQPSERRRRFVLHHGGRDQGAA